VPYGSNRELPNGVRENLPAHAQDIYREAFNNAHEQYADPKKRRDKADDPEEVAHKVAWSAVKQEYEKRNDRWVKKND
jgi:cation transport regulator